MSWHAELLKYMLDNNMSLSSFIYIHSSLVEILFEKLTGDEAKTTPESTLEIFSELMETELLKPKPRDNTLVGEAMNAMQFAKLLQMANAVLE